MVEDDGEGQIRTFQIVFEGVTCDDCGATVPVTTTCTCGAWTPRDDEHVKRRRPTVDDLRTILTPNTQKVDPIDFGDAIGDLSPWIEELFEGLASIGSDSADSGSLERSLERIAVLRARVVNNGRRRPWLALWDPILALVDELGAMAGAYLDALAAGSPNEARLHEQAGQAHLNKAARQIGLVNTRLDWWGFDHSIRMPTSLIEAAAAAYDTTGAANIVDLDAEGMALYERITGKANGPTGLGVGLLLDLGLLDRAFDESRVYRIARLVYERLDASRASFAALVSDPVRQADIAHARQVFYESQLQAETLLRELAGQRRIEASAVLRLGAQMTERVSGNLLNLVVSTGAKAPIKYTAEYTNVHQAARTSGLGDALLGFDGRIRNADAHADYEVGQDFVLLGRHRTHPEQVPDEELVDTVLASVESCAAILAAIDCAIADGGLPSGPSPIDELPVEERLSILLAVAGAHPRKIEMKCDRVELSAEAYASASLNPLSVIASIVGQVPADTRRLVLRLRRRSGPVVADVVVEPLRRAQAAEGLAKELAHIEFLARATINGRPVFPRRHVRFMLATFVHRMLDAPVDEVYASVELLEATARRMRDPDLVEAVRAFGVMRRAQIENRPVPASVRTAFLRIATYIGTPPGPWNDGSGAFTG